MKPFLTPGEMGVPPVLEHQCFYPLPVYIHSAFPLKKKKLPILTTSEQFSVIENKSLLSFQYLPASSQSMLQPLVSDIFSVCILRELDGTRPQQLRFKTCTSSLGGQAGITCLGPLNTAADRGKVYCESQKNLILEEVHVFY